MTERRSPTIIPVGASTGVARLAGEPGSTIPVYYLTEDGAELYRFIPQDDSTTDDVNVIAPSGGAPGRFHRVQKDDHGADLTAAAAQSLATAAGKIRILPTTVTLTEAVELSLSDTGAKAGDTIRVVRQNTDGFAVAVKTGSTTLATLPGDGTARWADFTFRSTSAGWYQSAAGSLLST